MSRDWPVLGQDGRGEGGVGEERQAAAHGHPDGGDGLVRLAAHLGQLRGQVRRRAAALRSRMSSASSGRLPETQRATVAQVQAGEGGGVEVGRAGSREALAAQKVASSTPFWLTDVGERVGAADRDGGVLAAVERVPPERGRHGADALRVEHVHRAAAGADAGGELEHVVLGGGGQDRAGVVQDDPGQPAGLAAAGRAEDHRVLVQGQAQARAGSGRGRARIE